MILLPVIERELRVAARHRQTYRNRFIAALGIIGVLLWALYDYRGSAEAVIGNEIFEYITFTALSVSLLAGFFHTADSISEERREGTLGLLYLTNLRSLHVVLGKLFARSLPAFFALATIIPVLGIPFLLGGISPGELERSCVVLLNALWLSLAAGLLASCLARDDRVALLITFALILIPTAIAPMFHHGELSSFWALVAARDIRFKLAPPNAFAIGMLQQFALPCVYVLLAALRARMIWRENPPSARGEKRLRKLREWTSGTPAQRKAWRSSMLDENPAIWLSCRRRERVAILWAILGGGALWLAWIWFNERSIDSFVAVVASILSHWVLKIAIAFAACRALSEEARNGSFELLFTTHLTPGGLVRGHLWGLSLSFGVIITVVVVADALWIKFGGMGKGFDTPIFFWCRVGVLLIDLATIAIYGLWLGFKLQHSGKAAVRILLLVVILPNLAWIFLLGSRDNYSMLVFIWLLMDAFLLGLGIQNLKGLRERAAQRFVPSSARG